jgi:hypothetical protein
LEVHDTQEEQQALATLDRIRNCGEADDEDEDEDEDDNRTSMFSKSLLMI